MREEHGQGNACHRVYRSYAESWSEQPRQAAGADAVPVVKGWRLASSQRAPGFIILV